MAVSIGIDLGTTNSALALRQISTTFALNEEGDELTPSCVAAPEGMKTHDGLLVGKKARDLTMQNPEYTVTSVKRLMGHDYDDPEVQKLIGGGSCSYQIVRDAHDEQGVQIQLRDFAMSPEEVSAAILKKVVSDARHTLGQDLSDAVVTVPAYFSDRQKYATRRACELAGIKLLRLLPEPTAAALAFGLNTTDDPAADQVQVVLVLDIGGGTFDVSLLNVADGLFMEVTKGGDMWLGGDDIDRLLIDWAYEKVAEVEGCGALTELISLLSVGERAKFVAQMRSEAEQAKIELCNGATSASLQVFSILKDKNGRSIDVDLDLSRKEFDKLIEPVVARIMKITNELLAEVGYETDLISSILMVGGSAQIPAIQHALRQRFGEDKVRVHPRPMFAVVEGAALMAHRLGGSEEEIGERLNLLHTTAHDYYLQLAGAKKHLLVARNTPLPVTVQERLRFSNKEQVLARLRVFNEVDRVMEPVGELWFHRYADTDDAQREVFRDPPTLLLNFTIDEDNIIKMAAVAEDRPGMEVTTEITRGNGALKLYQDLERCLADVAVNSPSRAEKMDSFILSSTVLDNIARFNDDRNDRDKPLLRQKIIKQMETIKSLALVEECLPRLTYENMIILQKELLGSFTSDEAKSELAAMHGQLRDLLQPLTDFTAIRDLVDKFDDFMKDQQTAETLLAAWQDSLGIEKLNKSDAKRLRQLCREAVQANAAGDQAKLDSSLQTIESILDDYTSSSSRHDQRFDRDVERVTT